MTRDVMAGVHSSVILECKCVYHSMEMLCNFDQILYATCTIDSNKKYSDRKL